MDDQETKVLMEMFPKIFHDVDPLFILPELYSILPHSFCEEIKRLPKRIDRVYKFMEIAINCMTFQELLKAFKFQDAYVYLIEELEVRLKHECQDHEVYTTIKIKLFSKHRKEMVEFRHMLKTFSLSGKHKEFKDEVSKVVSLWKDPTYRHTLDLKQRQQLADKYFFARDAQCENMRLQYKTELSSSEIIEEIHNIAPFTTNPLLITMMFLARKGSAIIMNDPSKRTETYIDFIETAIQHVESIPACRETGLVFYIQYNFKCLEYEENPSSGKKELLAAIACKAVSHFCREYEKVANDFKNIFHIKLAHQFLGIGVLGNNVRCLEISDSDIENAKERLSLLHEEQLSSRWKWGLNIAKAKIFWLEKDFDIANIYAQRAFKLAKTGNFSKEIKGTVELLEFLKDKRDPSILNDKNYVIKITRETNRKFIIIALIIIMFSLTVIFLFYKYYVTVYEITKQSLMDKNEL